MSTSANEPRVGIITPVYNGQEYLSDCIESVLSQEYGNFEYLIVDNRSSDDSAAVAQRYAQLDRRVRVVRHEAFVNAIENHNRGFRLAAPDWRYCKVVSADDWLLPACVRKLVQVAEAHPSAGIVGCYQQSGEAVKWRGVPATVTLLSGREAARMGLIDEVHILGTPTSVLYRADLVRSRKDFFPHNKSYADASACYECFRASDLGFVHEVLAAERVHAGQWSSEMDRLSAGSVGYLDILLQYGPLFLSAEGFARRRKEAFACYYRFLGGCLLKLRGRAFWKFHRSSVAELGCQLAWGRIVWEAMREVGREARHPLVALRKARVVLSSTSGG